MAPFFHYKGIYGNKEEGGIVGRWKHRDNDTATTKNTKS